MKKLCELVDIAINNENCVVFQVKDDARMDLIALGCFKGNEDMIRMTKGRSPEVTLFYKDDTNYSYHFGEGGHTVLGPSMQEQREMIRECCILDYGLVCDWSYMPNDIDYDKLIRETSDIRDMRDARRIISLNSGGGLSCNIRVNDQTMAINVNVKDVPAWFRERGFSSSFAGGVEAPGRLPCGNTYGVFKPLDPSLERDEEFLMKKALKLIQDDPVLADEIYQTLRFNGYKDDLWSAMFQKDEAYSSLSDDVLDGLAAKLMTELSGNQPYWDAYYESVDQVVNEYIAQPDLDTQIFNADKSRVGNSKAELSALRENER